MTLRTEEQTFVTNSTKQESVPPAAPQPASDAEDADNWRAFLLYNPGAAKDFLDYCAYDGLAAVPPPPDRNDLLAVGRAQSQHDAGGSRSSPATVPSTTEEKP